MPDTPDNNYTPSFQQELARYGYSTLLTCLVPFVVVVMWIQGLRRSQDFGSRIAERFGFVPKSMQAGGLLVHCVSVGEVVAASTVVKAIQKREPGLTITITTTTATGSQRVNEMFGDSVQHMYLPYDMPWAAAGFLDALRPCKVLIAEVELWPNFIHACWQRTIPVFVINARLTDRSAKRYGKFTKLFSAMLNKLSGVCAQGQRDYDNYLGLLPGAVKLHLTNNIKFDQTLSDAEIAKTVELRELLRCQDRKVLLAGSTHDPEEQMLLDSYQALKPDHPNLLLVLVPRYPQRFDKVSKLINKQGLQLQRLSNSEAVQPGTDVLLADAMGVLKPIYGLADVSFVGGSFADKGGHSALEPALHGVSIVMGPHIYNNPSICEALIQVDALHIVNDQQQLTQAIAARLHDQAQSQREGAAGKQVVSDNAGALRKTLSIIGF